MDERIEAVQRMQDYIKSNPEQDISMADLSKAAGYLVSPMPIYLFKPYGVKYSKRKNSKEMGEVKRIFIQIVEKPARKVIIKRGKPQRNILSIAKR